MFGFIFFVVYSPVHMTQLFHEMTYAVKLGTAFIQQGLNDPARRERVK